MAAMLRQRCPDAFFLIVGGVLRDDWEASRAYQAEMKDLAASLGLTDRCLFLENQQEMTALYNACDLTVLLSTREGTPNVVLESMACGVPVIATNVADNAAVVLDGETGFLVGPNEPEAAVSHAERIIKNNEARSRMGEAARRHVSHAYSLKVATDKLEAIYRTRLSAKHRRIPNLDGAQELA